MGSIAKLKHNDDIIATCELSDITGEILRYKCHVPEAMPYMREMSLKEINQWWKYRAVPESRKDLNKLLEESGCETAELLAAKNLALSLTDCYWMCPVSLDISWDKVNLYENAEHTSFKDSEGAEFSNNPNGTLNGTLNKEAVYENGRWVLYKQSETAGCEQNVNEVFSNMIHEKQKLSDDDYVRYGLVTRNGKPLFCKCDFFTSKKLEFIPAYNVAAYMKKDNSTSNYEHYINVCKHLGLDEHNVRIFMDYQTLSDFVITNTDRHYNNFGILRDPETLKVQKPAPIFDSGNSMFYRNAYKMSAYDILSLEITGMAKKEEQMLEFVQKKYLLETDLLPAKKEVLDFYCAHGITENMAEIIGSNYELKTEMVRQFQNGHKVSRYMVKDWESFKDQGNGSKQKETAILENKV